MSDDPIIRSPPHYVADGIEVKDVIRAFRLPYHLGDALAYILRADRKGQPIQDLEKAIQHLTFEIEYRKAGK